ncbi:MAG: hypothetical protein CM1200mP28_01480 [Deltaproteobacteria bacterium]|nr:MAG: hypothetical protein CM1200mP28_01480 [Deltaproteobacteria bacterium]
MFNYFKVKTGRIVFATMCMMLASVIFVFAQQNSNSTDSVSEPLSEQMTFQHQLYLGV